VTALAKIAGRRYRAGADADCGGEVRQYAQLREHGGRTDMTVELLDLAVAHVPAVGMSSLAPVGQITPAGVSNGPRKVPRIDSSIAATAERYCGPRRPRITGIR
jgi:hypothetical protein